MTSSIPAQHRSVRAAVWGCGHGELDTVFDSIEAINARAADGRKVELLICCGDFQAARNPEDLETMACPVKYRAMRTFYKYYAGDRVAPVLTIFVGGNHEASNHMQELHYGGWVAPRIYYLGASGVVNFRGLRIAGMSGIFKGYDFRTGYHERAPYTDDSVRSVFHVREFDYHKMHQLTGRVDVMISHDWPEGVYNHGDTAALLRRKAHFREEVAAGALGNPAHADLLARMKPRYWFAGHLHVKFAACVRHGNSGSAATAAAGDAASSASAGTGAAGEEGHCTRFLALDKCLPGKDFLQVMDIPVAPEETLSDYGSALGAAGSSSGSGSSAAGSDDAAGSDPLCAGLSYDDQWLAITAKTHAYTPASKRYPPLPQPQPISDAEVQALRQRMSHAAAVASSSGDGGSVQAPSSSARMHVPLNFVVTVPPFRPTHPGAESGPPPRVAQPPQRGNPQTDALLGLLGLPHVLTVPHGSIGGAGAAARASSHPPTTLVPTSLLAAGANAGRSRWDVGGEQGAPDDGQRAPGAQPLPGGGGQVAIAEVDPAEIDIE